MAEPLILAVAGDPGGANALAPALGWLRQQGCRIHAAGYRQAPALWAALGWQVEPLPEHGFDAAAWLAGHGAALLLTATSANGVDLERRLWQHARLSGLTSLALLDFWSNYPLRFQSSQDWIWPEHLAVMDAASAAELHTLGAPQIHITGQPALDALPALLQAFTPARRQVLRDDQQAGQSRTLLFVSQPLAALYGSEAAARQVVGYCEADVWADLVAAIPTLTRHTQVWVRSHPRECMSDWRSRLAPHAWARLAEGDNGRDWVLAADGVLGMNSMLLQEACLLGKSVMSYQPGLIGPDVLPANRHGWSTAVTRRAGFATQLAGWLDTLPPSSAPLPDGQATERLGMLVLELLVRG
ncbi:hypothetical protein GCM10007907_17110 [Chitinimonas prasina]|uniref:Capsular biosynthesis protein n=1 Tax=Chitinimonas prasina TaxID=1434937 RepID=A0ABQ5YD74_9NEIS|nr:hypothetical protein [Chitinimonas prasina]GLR12921.1 hypothetical protein GCM10007907_17110 [Chitinimonas prasina]